MFCKKCGNVVEEGVKFCGKCGTPVEMTNNYGQGTVSNNINSTINQNTNQMNNQKQGATINYNEKNANYDNIVNPSMKGYAIASIALPIVSILIYWFIGLTAYIAAILAGLGYMCANKGKAYSKKLSVTGYILNTVLLIMIVIAIISVYND